MKLRTLKRIKQTQMAINFFWGKPIGQHLTADFFAGSAVHRPEEEPPASLIWQQDERNLQAQSAYCVARVKDNEVVLETDDAAEAKEAIDKAARQKKAKLYLMRGNPFPEV